MSTVNYLDRFLEPVTEAFTPEVARKLVELRADAELEARVQVLLSPPFQPFYIRERWTHARPPPRRELAATGCR